MSDLSTALDELKAILSLGLDDCGSHSYEKNGAIKLLRSWEKRNTVQVVEQALSAISEKDCQYLSSPIDLWMFEQKINRPSVVGVDVINLWPNSIDIPEGAEHLLIDRLNCCLQEKPAAASNAIHYLRQQTEAFNRILKQPPLKERLANTINAFLSHPNKKIRENYYLFSPSLLSALHPKTKSLSAEIKIVELFEGSSAFAMAKKEATDFFLDDIVPLIKQVDPQDFSERSSSVIQRFLWDRVSPPQWPKIYKDLEASGWPPKQLARFMCPPPVSSYLNNRTKLNAMLPIWADHHSKKLLESVAGFISDPPTNDYEMKKIHELLTVLLPYGIEKSQLDDYVEKHVLFDFSKLCREAGLPKNMKVIVSTLQGASGTDAIADLLPPKLLGTYRVVEQLAGGRPVPLNTPIPYQYPRQEQQSLQELEQEESMAAAQRIYAFQQGYIALRQKISISLDMDVGSEPSKKARKL